MSRCQDCGVDILTGTALPRPGHPLGRLCHRCYFRRGESSSRLEIVASLVNAEEVQHGLEDRFVGRLIREHAELEGRPFLVEPPPWGRPGMSGVVTPSHLASKQEFAMRQAVEAGLDPDRAGKALRRVRKMLLVDGRTLEEIIGEGDVVALGGVNAR